jgi:hypothetical protein
MKGLGEFLPPGRLRVADVGDGLQMCRSTAKILNKPSRKREIEVSF